MVEYDASEIIVKGLVLELIPVQVIQARPTRGQAFVLVQKKRVRNSKGSGCFPFHFALLAFILAVPPCSPPPPSFTAVPMPATPPPLLHPLLMVIFPLLHLPHHLSDISKLDVIRSVPCIRWVLLSSVGPLWFLHIPSLLHPLLLVAVPLLTCLLTWLH